KRGRKSLEKPGLRIGDDDPQICARTLTLVTLEQTLHRIEKLSIGRPYGISKPDPDPGKPPERARLDLRQRVRDLSSHAKSLAIRCDHDLDNRARWHRRRQPNKHPERREVLRDRADLLAVGDQLNRQVHDHAVLTPSHSCTVARDSGLRTSASNHA